MIFLGRIAVATMMLCLMASPIVAAFRSSIAWVKPSKAATLSEVSTESMKVMEPSKTQRDTLVFSSLVQGSFNEKKAIVSPIDK
jgi:hypothetical protein